MNPELNTCQSLIELADTFPTEQSCIDYLEKCRWPNGVVSPYDPASTVYNYGNNRYRCKNTKKDFNVKTNTLFHATRLPLRKWFMAIWILSSHKKGISSYQLAKDLKVTQPTAWFMLQRIRNCYTQPKPQLTGEVELDETFVGGANRNRHANKKIKGCQGRSFKDKTPVFGMLERNGNLKAFVVKDTNVKSLIGLTMRHISREATIYMDEWSGYRIAKKIYEHGVVNHGGGQYVNGDASTNAIEGFWGIFKRGMKGIYNYVKPKHLQRYVDEFVYRYNTRKQVDGMRFNTLLCNTEHRLTFQKLVHG